MVWIKRKNREPTQKRSAFRGLLILFGLMIFFYNPIRTLASIKKVDEYPLYFMHYYGGNEFINWLGVVDRIAEMLEIPVIQPGTSSTFAALNPEGYAILGRNMDRWNGNQSPILILHTDPRNRNSAIALIPLDLLGIDGHEISWIERVRLLLSPYYVQDGMNEYGLSVAVTYVPCRIGQEDPHKPMINSSQAIRLLLGRAQNVDEAIALLENYNLRFTRACGHHHLADAYGNSAVVEYIDGQMEITRSQKYWQVATNFLLAETNLDGANGPCWRYNRAYEYLDDANGRITSKQAMGLLEEISASTIWSVVYNLSTGDMELAMGRNYGLQYNFELPMVNQYRPRFSPIKNAWLPLTPRDKFVKCY